MQAALDAKQDTISDLDTIRSDAALGKTAVQPIGLANYLTKDTFKPINWSYTNPANDDVNKLTLEKDDEYAYRLTLNTFTGNEIYDYNYTTTINSNEISLSDTVSNHVVIISPTDVKISDSRGYSFVMFDNMRMFYQGSDARYIYYDEIVTKKQLPTVPTKTSQLENDSGYITSSALTGYATESWVGQQGYQTASDVSTAVSTAISGQTKESWKFVFADGSTVIKSVVLG